MGQRLTFHRRVTAIATLLLLSMPLFALSVRAANLATPGLDTTLSCSLTCGTIMAGGSAFDKATLFGGNNPTGTVTFFFSSVNTCPSPSATQVGSPLNAQFFEPSSGNYNPFITSIPHTFDAAGTYYWYAAYSGDANNYQVTSACEPLVVVPVGAGPATPTLTVSLSSSSIEEAGSVTVTAALGEGNNPTGSMTFYFSASSSCPSSSDLVVGELTNVFGNGNYGVLPGLLFLPGTYYFHAVYGGDPANSAVTSACVALDVTASNLHAAAPTLTLTLVQNSVPGDFFGVIGTAALSGGDSPTGSITFFATDACQTSLAALFGASITVPNPGGYQQFLTPGQLNSGQTYYWFAVYSGDSNNNRVVSACQSLTVGVNLYWKLIFYIAAPTSAGAPLTGGSVISGGYSGHGFMQFATNDGPDAGRTDLVFGKGSVRDAAPTGDGYIRGPGHPEPTDWDLVDASGNLQLVTGHNRDGTPNYNGLLESQHHWSWRIVYSVTQEQYNAAADYVDSQVVNPSGYNLFTSNCVDWIGSVAGAAHITLPNLTDSVGISEPSSAIDALSSIGNGRTFHHSGDAPTTIGVAQQNMNGALPTAGADPLDPLQAGLDATANMLLSHPSDLAASMGILLDPQVLSDQTVNIGGQLNLALQGVDLSAAVSVVDFGDGSAATRQFLGTSHTFVSAGIFPVHVVVLDDGAIEDFSFNANVLAGSPNSADVSIIVPNPPGYPPTAPIPLGELVAVTPTTTSGGTGVPEFAPNLAVLIVGVSFAAIAVVRRAVRHHLPGRDYD